MNLSTIQLLCKILPIAVLLETSHIALANAQSDILPNRDQLELPEVETKDRQGVQVNIDRDSKSRPNCPFDNSDLTTELSGVSFQKFSGGELDTRISGSLSTVAIPLGVQPLSVVCDIRDEANEKLRKAGWIAKVQIPQQDLVDNLRMDVVTARISEIRVVGDTGPYRNVLEKRIRKITELDPLNEREVEQILLEINDLPGMSVRLGLAPRGTQAGDFIGNLTVTHERYRGYFNARNYNPNRIGRETGYGRLEYYGLTGYGDISFVGAQATADFEEQLIVQAGHEFGLKGNGIRFGAEGTYAMSKPDIEGLNLDTNALLFKAYASYPLMRTLRRNADLVAGFEYADQSTNIGDITLSEDALRTITLRGELSGEDLYIDGESRLFYDTYLEIRQGLDVLGATNVNDFGVAVTGDSQASRPFGRADALVVRARADLYAPLVSTVGIGARLEGQWTDDPLLNYDEYSIGNLSIGRGYDPGANSGDIALGGAFELTASPFKFDDNKLDVFGFYDVVRIENLDRFTPQPVRTLQSVGAGLRFYFGDGLKAEVTYASPMDRAIFSDEFKPSERVLLSLTTKFPSLLR